MPICNPALKKFWWSDKTIRIRVLFGGRSSSKSWDAAAVAITIASKCKIRFLCVRQFQARITDSVYTLLKQTIIRLGLSSVFDIQRNKIICTLTGSEFIFYGLWRNIEEIRGMEGVGICWIEEAHLMTEEQWQILEPTIIRNKDYQIWVIFNPRLATDFSYKRFVVNPPKNTLVRKINYQENPFLNDQAIEVIEELKDNNYDDYEHFYLGEPRDNDDDSIIKRSWIMAAIDAHKKLGLEPVGSKRIGFDVADSGDDLCATAETHGNLTVNLDQWKAAEDQIYESCARVYNKVRNRIDDNIEIIYDGIGVGAGCGSNFNQMQYINHRKFMAGGAVSRPDARVDKHNKTRNKDFYSNIKAQAWWLIALKLQNTYNAIEHGREFELEDMLFISSNCPHLEQLIFELSLPRKSFDSLGRVMVEDKKTMKKRGIPSPNLADAFIMANLPRFVR